MGMLDFNVAVTMCNHAYSCLVNFKVSRTAGHTLTNKLLHMHPSSSITTCRCTARHASCQELTWQQGSLVSNAAIQPHMAQEELPEMHSMYSIHSRKCKQSRADLGLGRPGWHCRCAATHGQRRATPAVIQHAQRAPSPPASLGLLPWHCGSA